MRRTLFICTLAVLTSASLAAQTAPPAPAPAKPAAPPAKPAAPRADPPAKLATITIQVTDALGAPLADTTVTTITGVVSREGVTAADGSLRMMNMRPGTYRLRFEREGSMTLERELTLRSGEALTVDVVAQSLRRQLQRRLSRSRRAPTRAALGPPGDPKVTPVPLFLEKNFIGGREGRKDSVLGCTPTGTATLHQLRDPWLAHTHDDAEEWIYVVAG